MWGSPVDTEWLNEWAVAIRICHGTRTNDSLASIKTRISSDCKGGNLERGGTLTAASSIGAANTCLNPTSTPKVSRETKTFIVAMATKECVTRVDEMPDRQDAWLKYQCLAE